MKTSMMYQSKHLTMSDFPTPTVLTIRGVALEEIGRGDKRWVAYFGEHTKGMVLNATKIKQLEMTFGDESDHWVGRKIKAKADPNRTMNGKVTGGIELIMPNLAGSPAPTPPPPPPPAPTNDGFDDDIPF